MSSANQALQRPIRVVMFGGGPVMERGARLFLCRLEEHSQIDLLAAFCQSEGQSARTIASDLWRRRGLLAIPLLALQKLDAVVHSLRDSQGNALLQRMMPALAGRIHYIPDIHAPEILQTVGELEPDLGLIYGSPILKPELFALPRLGTLGIHHGKVPEYRGKKTTFWAIYHGEQTAGVTIQKINAGLDTGEIVLAGTVPIGNRFPGTVWNELEKLGIELYLQAILQMRDGTARSRPQVGKRGKLFRDPDLKDIMTVWVRQLRKKVRAQ